MNRFLWQKHNCANQTAKNLLMEWLCRSTMKTRTAGQKAGNVNEKWECDSVCLFWYVVAQVISAAIPVWSS